MGGPTRFLERTAHEANFFYEFATTAVCWELRLTGKNGIPEDGCSDCKVKRISSSFLCFVFCCGMSFLCEVPSLNAAVASSLPHKNINASQWRWGRKTWGQSHAPSIRRKQEFWLAIIHTPPTSLQGSHFRDFSKLGVVDQTPLSSGNASTSAFLEQPSCSPLWSIMLEFSVKAWRRIAGSSAIEYLFCFAW